MVTVRPDRRLALLALAKFAGLGAMIGLVVGVGMTLDGETKWSLLLGPLTLAAGGAATLGCFMALIWWIFPGQVTYAVVDGYLVARRGRRLRKRIAVERIAEIEFDEDIDIEGSGKGHGVIMPFDAGKVMTPVLALAAGGNGSHLDRNPGPVGQQGAMLLNDIEHAHAHIAETGYSETQSVSHIVRRGFQVKGGLSYA